MIVASSRGVLELLALQTRLRPPIKVYLRIDISRVDESFGQDIFSEFVLSYYLLRRSIQMMWNKLDMGRSLELLSFVKKDIQGLPVACTINTYYNR